MVFSEYHAKTAFSVTYCIHLLSNLDEEIGIHKTVLRSHTFRLKS